MCPITSSAATFAALAPTDTEFENPRSSSERIALSTQDLSDGYLGDYLVPLIAVSFVLLAAAIGAIVLARKD